MSQRDDPLRFGRYKIAQAMLSHRGGPRPNINGAMRKNQTAGGDTVFDAIAQLGHDEDYRPPNAAWPTNARPGTPEKLAIIAARVQSGQPLFVDGDAHCKAERTYRDDDDEVQRQLRRLLDEMSQKVDDDEEF